MRLYVAGASAEPERVAWAMDAARALGCEVFDWRAGFRPTAEMTREERAAAGFADFREIEFADLVWVLAPAGRSDSLVEMGYALAMRDIVRGTYDEAPVIVSGPLAQRGIFAALADEEHDTDEAALASIERRVRGEGGA